MRIWLKTKILLSDFGSQRAFCMAICKSDDWLSRIIVGRTDPSQKEMELIAHTLKTHCSDQLFFDAEKVSPEAKSAYGEE